MKQMKKIDRCKELSKIKVTLQSRQSKIPETLQSTYFQEYIYANQLRPFKATGKYFAYQKMTKFDKDYQKSKKTTKNHNFFNSGDQNMHI